MEEKVLLVDDEKDKKILLKPSVKGWKTAE